MTNGQVIMHVCIFLTCLSTSQLSSFCLVAFTVQLCISQVIVVLGKLQTYEDSKT